MFHWFMLIVFLVFTSLERIIVLVLCAALWSWRRLVHTLDALATASLTGRLPITFDFASLAFITGE